MKIIRIYYPLILTFLLLAGNVAVSKEELLQQIKTVEEKVFPQGNLFDQRLNNVDSWNNLISDIQNYVTSSSDRRLINMFNQDKQIAQELINTMQWVRLRVLSPSISSGKVYPNYLLAKNRIKKLAARKEELVNNEKSLKNIGGIASKVILQFTLLIKRLIDRSVLDLKIVGKKLRPSALFYSG